MDENKNLLEEELENQIVELKTLEPGSEEKARAVEDVNKLYKLHVEEKKIELEETRILIESKERRKDQLIKSAEIGLGVATLGSCIVMSILGFVFEERGAINSSTMKNWYGVFKPKRIG